MIKVAETYIKLRLDTSDEFRIAATSDLYHRGKAFACDVFPGEFGLFVRIKEGSFIAWVPVYIGALWVFITKYESFRSGIIQMVKDARRFSDYLIHHFLRNAKITDDKVIRLERRFGVPGKIKRVFSRIDQIVNTIHMSQTIEKVEGKTVISQYVGIDKNELEKTKKEIIKIFELIEDDKDRRLFFESLPESFRSEMPADFSEELFRIPKKYIIKKEDEIFLAPPKVKKLPPRKGKGDAGKKIN